MSSGIEARSIADMGASGAGWCGNAYDEDVASDRCPGARGSSREARARARLYDP